MTRTLELTTRTRNIVLPIDEWVTIRSGPTNSNAPGSGTTALVTLTAASTPGCVCAVRIRSKVTGNESNQNSVFGPATVRLGPVTTATGLDVIEIQAKRISGSGGLIVVGAAGLQGTFVAADNPTPVTQTGITQQPQNRSTTSNSPVSFTVSAVGQNITYLWERSVNAGTSWTTAGTGATLIVTPADETANGDLYRVTVTGDNDPGGNPVVSNTVTLTVDDSQLADAVILSQPQDMSVSEGSTADFVATGSNITDWNVYRRTTGTGNGTDIGGGTNWVSDTVNYPHTVAQPAHDGWEYQFGLIGPSGVEVFTRWARLTVTVAPQGGPMVTDSRRGA